jgi:hypothetical protein
MSQNQNSYWMVDENGKSEFIDNNSEQFYSEIKEWLDQHFKINEEEIEKMNKYFNE